MLKTLRVFTALFKNNLVREMEYRSNFFLNILVALFWVALQVETIEIYFQFTNQIYGWTKFEVVALAGIIRLVKGLHDCFSRPNLLSFPDAVSRGELDYTLTRPVDSQMLVSFRRQILSEIIIMMTGLAMLAYYFIGSGAKFGVSAVVLIIYGTALGYLAFYSIIFIFTTLSLFMTRMSAIKQIQDVFSHTMRYPSDLYSRGNHLAEFFLLPIFVIGTLPTKILLEKGNLPLITLQLFLCLGIFLSSRAFWQFAVKRYSSASS